jgi:hypothetical protein
MLSGPRTDLIDQEAACPAELGQTLVAELLEQVDDGDRANILRLPDRDNGPIEQSKPKHPPDPKDHCSKKKQWERVRNFPCGSAWGG